MVAQSGDTLPTRTGSTSFIAPMIGRTGPQSFGTGTVVCSLA